MKIVFLDEFNSFRELVTYSITSKEEIISKTGYVTE